ncbi:MAG TPA: hypothetical protein VJS64_04830 [Pyrinomonadaceae bacterium]|nr:hypothetical protein [Pyrinomonadaceae bacterium]
MPSVIASLLQKAVDKQRVQSQLENLTDGSFEKTSDVSGAYNCIAHAAYDSRRKWWPIPLQHARLDRHWPDGVPRRRTIRVFRLAFEKEGYELCDDGSLEEGFEKVVLYVSDTATAEDPLNAPTHMARQLPCGKWTSKLGEDIDIVHDIPERVTGRVYGRIELYMRRNRMPLIKHETKATT